jgi:hypothetical protein
MMVAPAKGKMFNEAVQVSMIARGNSLDPGRAHHGESAHGTE